MASKLLLTSLLGLSVAGAIAAPARAQFFFGGGPRFYEPAPRVAPDAAPAPSPRVIQQQLARQGWRLVGAMRFNGDVVLADAVNGYGAQARLVIDPDSGAVLQRFATLEPRPPGGLRPRVGDYLYEGDNGPVIGHGPSTGFLQDGSPAPEQPLPRAPAQRAAKPKPKAVAKATPSQPPKGETPPASTSGAGAPPNLARAAPEGQGAPGTAASTPPDLPSREGPLPTPRKEAAAAPRPTPAASPAAAPAPIAPASAPRNDPPQQTWVAPEKPVQAAPAKPADAGGVPLNPLD